MVIYNLYIWGGIIPANYFAFCSNEYKKTAQWAVYIQL